MAYKLSALDSIHISTVLEECIDQLAILGRVMPANSTSEKKKDGNSEVVDLIEHQKYLEKQHETLVLAPKSDDTDAEISNVTKAIHLNTQEINKIFRRNKFVQDIGQKVQADRKFLHEVLELTLKEISQTQSFDILVEAVGKEAVHKTEVQNIMAQEEESRKLVKKLQRAIIDNRNEQETEGQKRNELIAHLKDELQETKAKTTMESKYIWKDAEVRVACSQKKCQQAEEALKEEIHTLTKKIENELRCNSNVESFLRKHHTLLEEKVEFWMDKYDNDVEAKQVELDNLKAKKASDLARLQELTQRYEDYDKVVQEDKEEKERLRKEAERELDEIRACTKLQSWWRGVMVRRQLGPYKPNKKGKKGKKGGKKGKKAKKK